MWFRVCFIVHLSISSYSSFIYAVAIVLIIVGQVLNLQVYQALGKTGVYYGKSYCFVVVSYSRFLNFNFFDFSKKKKTIVIFQPSIGNRFNKKVPWVQGWPFNYISNPQYIGFVLILILKYYIFVNENFFFFFDSVILTLIGGFVWLPSNFIISGIISCNNYHLHSYILFFLVGDNNF